MQEKTNSFEYLGFTFTPVRSFKDQEEIDKVFNELTSIDKQKLSNYLGGKYSWNDFYEEAKKHGLDKFDVYLINGICEVSPCTNEIMALNKEEAEKYKTYVYINTGRVYKTIIQVEILSDTPNDVSNMSLDEIHYEMTNGSFSGVINVVSENQQFVGKNAVEEIKKQGSDPSFFFIDEDGMKMEDENYV